MASADAGLCMTHIGTAGRAVLCAGGGESSKGLGGRLSADPSGAPSWHARPSAGPSGALLLRPINCRALSSVRPVLT